MQMQYFLNGLTGVGDVKTLETFCAANRCDKRLSTVLRMIFSPIKKDKWIYSKVHYDNSIWRWLKRLQMPLLSVFHDAEMWQKGPTTNKLTFANIVLESTRARSIKLESPIDLWTLLRDKQQTNTNRLPYR